MLTIEEAYRQQERYRGSQEIRDAISQTALIAFVGGTAVGKNFMMERTKLPVTGTETTREPRPDDDPSRYTYTPLPDLLDAIENCQVVQYGVSMPHNIYASRVTDYELGAPNVADIWHDAVRPLGNKGFKQVRSVSILTPKAQWISQLGVRFEGMNVGQAGARLDEARQSIRWSVAQHMGGTANHLLIVNDVYGADTNAEKIVDFAHGKPAARLSDHDVSAAAAEMLEAIDFMNKRIRG
jgi:hypothetical protein